MNCLFGALLLVCVSSSFLPSIDAFKPFVSNAATLSKTMVVSPLEEELSPYCGSYNDCAPGATSTYQESLFHGVKGELPTSGEATLAMLNSTCDGPILMRMRQFQSLTHINGSEYNMTITDLKFTLSEAFLKQLNCSNTPDVEFSINEANCGGMGGLLIGSFKEQIGQVSKTSLVFNATHVIIDRFTILPRTNDNGCETDSKTVDTILIVVSILAAIVLVVFIVLMILMSSKNSKKTLKKTTQPATTAAPVAAAPVETAPATVVEIPAAAPVEAPAPVAPAAAEAPKKNISL